MVLSAICAVVVFVLVASYISNLRSQIGAMTTVLQVQRAVPILGSPAEAVKEVQVPSRYAVSSQLHNKADIGNQVAATDIPEGAYLEQGMLIDPPQLKPTQRKVLVNDTSGLRMSAGEHVDVYAVVDEEGGKCVKLVLPDQEILAVGGAAGATGGGESGGAASQLLADGGTQVAFALSQRAATMMTDIISNYTIRLAPIGKNTPKHKPSVYQWCPGDKLSRKGH